jgi:Protein of unknown function (DUF1566)
MTEQTTRPKIGDLMPDDTVYAGISPDTNKPMYATPADAKLTYTFNAAAEFAKEKSYQKVYGHGDWRVPTKAELNVLFNNRAAIGGFNVSGTFTDGWYWPSDPDGATAWGQRFSDGSQFYNVGKENRLSLRLVR